MHAPIKLLPVYARVVLESSTLAISAMGKLNNSVSDRENARDERFKNRGKAEVGVSPVSRANCIGAEIVSNFPAAAQNASSLLYGLINAKHGWDSTPGCLK
mmetsp:Transcript_472/g.1880  ORF Transcript_472/g.1880 Transcript_472/m.1880 type:complete len:101 (-) Transcript_472:1422-1724(-)